MSRSNGLKLDLTENTPGNSLARLPNLVEHAEICSQGNAGIGENLSSKLPNVVEGSMDYGSERRYSRHFEYEAKTYPEPEVGSANGYDNGYAGRGGAGYGSRSFDRKTGTLEREAASERERYDGCRIYPEENGSRYERRVQENRAYQESDLDAPYDPPKPRYEGFHGRRYSREVKPDPADYEYEARYADETLKLEKKERPPKLYEGPSSKGYESGVRTHDSSYELSSAHGSDLDPRKYDSKFHPGAKMYGTLPRYEATSKSYDGKFEATDKDGTSATYDSKYDLPPKSLYGSKTYDGKYADSARYEQGPKNYEQTFKIGESSSHPRSVSQPREPDDPSLEKANGYRKSNFEAYGVYSDPEDDHGFLADKKLPQYTYKGVVVNVSGESSVVEQKRPKNGQTEAQRSPWCRPTILLLLLVLLVVIFVLVAGILLYFNCKLFFQTSR